MSSKKKYAIVDLETTGGMAQRDKIIEVGIVIFDGEQILESYETLVNPERSVPPNITQITGIDTSMIIDAPKFFEIAKKVVELTEGCIFVAHNVNFDYGFLRAEYQRLGYTFTKRKMCTVRLTRKCFPGLPSYSLGNLIKHFGISVNARHRALDDAMATTELLKKILYTENAEFEVKHLINHGVRESKLPPSLNLEFLHSLPESCGVYYMHNSFEKVVYVGKSVNIQKRIMQHFAETTRKAEKMRSSVHHISYEETGSELVSMILESNEIKRLQPEINKAQRAKDFPYVVYEDINEDGYKLFRVGRNSKRIRNAYPVIHAFPKERSAKANIRSVLHHFELCAVVNEFEVSTNSCFNYKIKKCLGACCHQEDAHSYNERFDEAKTAILSQLEGSFFIIEEGKTHEEYALIHIEDGVFQGYGFINDDIQSMDSMLLMDHITPSAGNQEITQIILRYLSMKPKLKILPY